MRSKHELASWLAPAFGIWIVACSGSSSGSAGAVSADQACSDFASAACQALSGCTAFLIQDVYGDVTTCSTRLKASCGDALAANGTGLTPALRESCVKALPAASCADLYDNNFPSECQAVAGQLANGATCGDSSQCKSAYCNLGADGTCGACGAARGAPDAACLRNDDCDYGSLCTGGKCAVPVTAGGTCDTAHPCQQTLACKGGVCATPDEAGAACTTGSCDQPKGLYCSTGAGPVCTSIGLATAGKACGLVGGGLTVCSAGGHCNVVTGTGAGTCAAAAADGAACDDTNGPTCLPPAVCGATSKVCTLPDPANCH
jgi:hypothetical protein